jgi:hypothetical protein
MFNATTIQSCLSGLIGFKQHYNSAYDRLDSDVSAALTGIYIDQTVHSLFTIENIAAVAENFSNTDVVAWSGTVTYKKGDIVLSASKIYESKVDDNTNNTPASSTSQWLETNLLSAYLRRLINGASLNLFTSVFQQKKLYEAGKTLLTDVSLYDGVGNLSKKVAKMSRFVGYQITPKFKDTVITIQWAGFQFDTANPEFPLYVYHSSQRDPIEEITVNVNTPVSFTWKELSTTLKLRANSNTYGDNGTFFIGYYEDDLIGRAIWKDQSFSGSSCSSCSNIDSYLYRQWSKYFRLEPFYVEEAYLNDDKTIFDVEKAIYLTNQNWGLNFKLQVQCDLSDFICRSKFIFADALKKQVTHDLLRDMAYSMRDNQRKEKVQQLAMLALKGDKQDYGKGAEADLQDAIKAISFDMSGISGVCMPCNSAGNGIVYSSHFG